ncbi:DUF4339 domain-containing protein [Rubripirellula sp.]|nr:DUF4339 domain-containing protein [Rubripirellula sp.]MDA7873834.1 DUF4339 domain-containing protein [Rhodopirellula sp.]MDB4645044.1 DUF4339 domain-containing protein [Rubripirellula sp.]
MGQEWFVKDGAETLGPLSHGELKQLAVDAKICPETEVRLGLEGQWGQASRVKGLLSKRLGESVEPVGNHPTRQVSSSDSGCRVPDDASNLGESAWPVEFVQQKDSALNPYHPTMLSEKEQVLLRESDKDGLRVTRMGLLTCYYAICVMLICFISGVLLPVLFGVTGSGSTSFMFAGVVLIGVGLLWLGGVVAFVVGQILCLYVPRGSGGKGYVKVALSMHLVWLLLTVVDSVGLRGNVSVVFAGGFAALTNLSIPVGEICFLLFIKKLALYIGQFDLASSAASVSRLSIVLVLGSLVYSFLIVGVTAGVRSDWMVVAGVLVFALVALIVFIRSAILLVRLARTISSA